jgi:hypothetical protein
LSGGIGQERHALADPLPSTGRRFVVFLKVAALVQQPLHFCCGL